MLGLPGLVGYVLAGQIPPQSPPLQNAGGSITVIFPANIWHYLIAVIAGLLVGMIVYRVTRFLARRHQSVFAFVCLLYLLQASCISSAYWFITDDDYRHHNIVYPPNVTHTCERQLGDNSFRLIDYGYSERIFTQISQDQGKSWRDLWLLYGNNAFDCDDFDTSQSVIWGRDQNTLLISKDGGRNWSFWNPGMVDPPIENYNWKYSHIESVQFESPMRGQMHLAPNVTAEQIGSLDLQTEDGGLHWSVVETGTPPQ